MSRFEIPIANVELSIKYVSMRAPTLHKTAILTVLRTSALATLIALNTLGPAIPFEMLAFSCDQERNAGPCCDCCADCDTLAGVNDCLAICFTAYALSAGAPDIATSQVRPHARNPRCGWLQRFARPEPEPPRDCRPPTEALDA